MRSFRLIDKSSGINDIPRENKRHLINFSNSPCYNIRGKIINIAQNKLPNRNTIHTICFILRPIIFKREKCSLQTAVGYIDKKLWYVLSSHSVSKFLLWTIQVYLGCGLCHNSLDRRVYIYYGLHIRIFVILPAQKQVYHRIIYKTCHQ